MSLAHELESIAALTWRDCLRFLRDRNQVLGALARPLLWLLLMGKGLRSALPQVGGLDYQAFVFAGALAMTTLFGGMFQSITMIWDREFGFLKEVLVAPIARTTIVVGKVLSGAAVTLLTGLFAVIFAPLVHVHVTLAQFAGLLGVLTLWSIAVTALGVVVAARMETFEGFGVISNFVVLPLYFLSGGVFPVEHLPGWMAVLVHVNPTTYAVDLMRHALGQPHVFPLALGAAVLSGFAAAMVALALVLFRRG
jgi:ABC-2 type transport system permease protein